MQALPNIDDIWDYENPKETAEIFLELLTHKSTDNLSYFLELETQLARTHSLRMNFEAAHKILDAVENNLTEEMGVVKIRYFLERGRTFNSNQEVDKAKRIFNKAFALAEYTNEIFYAVDAAHMMGIACNYPESLEWNLIAVKLAEESELEKPKKWMGSLHNNIGWTYHEQNEYSNALKHFEKALAYRESEADLSKILIAKWCIARCYRSLGKLNEALNLQEHILKTRTVNNLKPSGYNFEELGELHLLLNHETECKVFFKKAHDFLSRDNWLARNEIDRLNRIRELAK